MSSFAQEWAKSVTEKLVNLEARVSRLENNSHQTTGKTRPIPSNNSAKGPLGSISGLVQEGFLNTPKTQKEVQNELERQGYYYSKQAIHMSLKGLMKRKGIITRIGKKGEWQYVVKK